MVFVSMAIGIAFVALAAYVFAGAIAGVLADYWKERQR